MIRKNERKKENKKEMVREKEKKWRKDNFCLVYMFYGILTPNELFKAEI